MKICIEISGHFKLYDRIYTNFLEYLYLPLSKLGEIDVIISTWSKLHTKDTISSYNGDCPIECGDTNSKDILDKYNGKIIQITDFDKIKHNFNYKQFFTEDKDYQFYPGHIQSNLFVSTPMFYQWYLCNQLKKEQEKLGRFKYDWVIRMRPDIFFLRSPDLSNIDTNNIYNRNLHSDFFYLSSSENIDMLCDIFWHLEEIVRKNFNNAPFNFVPYCSEYFIEHYLKEKNITVNKRKELGGEFFYFYPRKYFIESCYQTLKSAGRENELYGIISKYKL